MYDKAYFLKRFDAYTDEELVAHAMSTELSDAAVAAVDELKRRRGLEGERLELAVSRARKGALRRSGIDNHCDYCGASIALGAVHDGGQRFCTTRCLREVRLLDASVDLDQGLITEHAFAMMAAPCPRCRRRTGDVEVRRAYRIIGAFVVTHASEDAEVCCSRCGRRRNMRALIGCALFGWWSLNGLVRTPARLYRNIAEMRERAPQQPSDALRHRARLALAEQLAPASLPLGHGDR